MEGIKNESKGKNGPIGLCTCCGSSNTVWYPETDINVCFDCGCVMFPKQSKNS